METCAAAIDLEDAYNRVPLDFLMTIMLQLQVSPFIVRWIVSALFQGQVVLKCGSWSSAPTVISPELPQGSSLSPVLFNVYTVQITSCQIARPGRTMSYADDILVHRQGRDIKTIARNLQRELDRIGEWCSNSGAFVNPSKASITWFSLNNHIVNTSTPSVTLRGDVLERTSTM